MKRILLAGAIALLPVAGFADDVFGTWKTTPDDNNNFGHIKVAACGSKICGTLVKAFGDDGNEIESENVGKKIIWDMKADGDGYYSGGKVWSPDRDKTYKSKMRLTGNQLGIKGCVLGICRDGGKWTRVK
ncbi:MAG: DUF2147 domain-containing protein [Rhodobacteraceae bacterium]|nr:DUF2147 domain-containing protein [Paracoccaceae bacterium]